MRQQTLVEMHEILNQMLREFDESGQEQFEIISMVRSMSENVQGMIEKFAKLAGDAMINLRAMVMTKSGDEGAMKVEHGLTASVNGAADALARLKVELDNLVAELNLPPSDLDQTGGMGMDQGMGGMDQGMGGDMGAGGMDQGMGQDQGMDQGMGGDMAANDNAAQMGGAANAAQPMPGGENIQPERPRKKA
jgi:hypothetical protein